MTITEAKKLKAGDIVNAPIHNIYNARVKYISESINVDIYGREYIWVSTDRGTISSAQLN